MEWKRKIGMALVRGLALNHPTPETPSEHKDNKEDIELAQRFNDRRPEDEPEQDQTNNHKNPSGK